MDSNRPGGNANHSQTERPGSTGPGPIRRGRRRSSSSSVNHTSSGHSLSLNIPGTSAGTRASSSQMSSPASAGTSVQTPSSTGSASSPTGRSIHDASSARSREHTRPASTASRPYGRYTSSRRNSGILHGAPSGNQGDRSTASEASVPYYPSLQQDMMDPHRVQALGNTLQSMYLSHPPKTQQPQSYSQGSQSNAAQRPGSSSFGRGGTVALYGTISPAPTGPVILTITVNGESSRAPGVQVQQGHQGSFHPRPSQEGGQGDWDQESEGDDGYGSQ